jgi:hypothetical protein
MVAVLSWLSYELTRCFCLHSGFLESHSMGVIHWASETNPHRDRRSTRSAWNDKSDSPVRVWDSSDCVMIRAGRGVQFNRSKVGLGYHGYLRWETQVILFHTQRSSQV